MKRRGQLSEINKENNNSAEIQRRDYLANNAYYGLQKYLCREPNYLIRTIVMYGFQTRTISKQDAYLL